MIVKIILANLLSKASKKRNAVAEVILFESFILEKKLK